MHEAARRSTQPQRPGGRQPHWREHSPSQTHSPGPGNQRPKDGAPSLGPAQRMQTDSNGQPVGPSKARRLAGPSRHWLVRDAAGSDGN